MTFCIIITFHNTKINNLALKIVHTLQIDLKMYEEMSIIII